MRLLAKGNEQLDEGNISAARLFFERAADAGLAEGAMALAATFDAAELGRLNVRGIKADSKLARQWYERARQLGAGAADERLRRLGANCRLGLPATRPGLSAERRDRAPATPRNARVPRHGAGA